MEETDKFIVQELYEKPEEIRVEVPEISMVEEESAKEVKPIEL